MAWMICGTVPDASFPLTGGRWRLDGGFLHAEGGGIAPLSVQRGTPAALLAGDIGNGDGSRKLYSRLAASPSLSGVRGITFHYLFPDLDGHNRVLMALEEADPKPVLVADAGFMYVAKMSGYADAYDLFTPDAGELAFLADEKAPHPFYTRGFLLAADEDILIARLKGRGVSEQEARRRLAAQMSQEEKIALCDVVLYNNADRESLKRQVLSCLERHR